MTEEYYLCSYFKNNTVFVQTSSQCDEMIHLHAKMIFFLNYVTGKVCDMNIGYMTSFSICKQLNMIWHGFNQISMHFSQLFIMIPDPNYITS